MSQSHRELPPLKIGFDRNIALPELYQMTKSRKNEWGIDGYSVPKTLNYISRSPVFSKDTRKDAFLMALKRSTEPDPGKYSPDFQTSKKMWVSPSARFLKAKKVTAIDTMINYNKTLPGPGTYFNEPLSPKPHQTIQ